MKIPMGSFQVYDALSILVKLEKPLIKHLESFILLPKKVANCIIFSKLLIENSNSRTRKNSRTGSSKVSASMVGGMFAIVAMSC